VRIGLGGRHAEVIGALAAGDCDVEQLTRPTANLGSTSHGPRQITTASTPYGWLGGVSAAP
jgi:hypothetical protein